MRAKSRKPSVYHSINTQAAPCASSILIQKRPPTHGLAVGTSTFKKDAILLRSTWGHNWLPANWANGIGLAVCSAFSAVDRALPSGRKRLFLSGKHLSPPRLVAGQRGIVTSFHPSIQLNHCTPQSMGFIPLLGYDRSEDGLLVTLKANLLVIFHPVLMYVTLPFRHLGMFLPRNPGRLRSNAHLAVKS